MLRLPLALVSTMLGVMLVVDLAYAQPEDAPPPGGRRQRMMHQGMGRGMLAPGGGVLGLLRLEQVQKELNLSDEQKEKLKEFAREALGNMRRERPADWQSLTPEQRKAKREERHKKAAETAEKVWKRLAEILEPEQLERLKQIHLQAQGAAALNDPEVAKSLGITDQQREELNPLYKQADEQRKKILEPLRNLSREERREKAAKVREKVAKIRKELMEKALEVLTPEQREKFENMQGKKIDLDFSALRLRWPRPQWSAPENID